MNHLHYTLHGPSRSKKPLSVVMGVVVLLVIGLLIGSMLEIKLCNEIMSNIVGGL